MKINWKDLAVTSGISVLFYILIVMFIPGEYQFCTGDCTGNLAKCNCDIVTLSPIFGVYLATLLGTFYYSFRNKPALIDVVAILIILFIELSVVYILFPLPFILLRNLTET